MLPLQPRLVEVHSSDDGDWERLMVDGELVYENHSIPSDEWADMIRKHFGVEVIEESHNEAWWDNPPWRTSA